MKLKNKITGEINEFMIHKRIEDSEDGNPVYAPFDGDIDEWEDYNEKPKEYWYISDFGYVFNHEINNKSVKSTIEEMKSIGNYFLSREEAELAVRKLKAWKRLKDKGFRFIDHIDRDSGQGITRYEWDGYVHGEDLDLLFSQEDD